MLQSEVINLGSPLDERALIASGSAPDRRSQPGLPYKIARHDQGLGILFFVYIPEASFRSQCTQLDAQQMGL